MSFTRKKLREIIPVINRDEEDALIDLYLTSSYRLKHRIAELEEENRALLRINRVAESAKK